jgi:hypothetical protein
VKKTGFLDRMLFFWRGAPMPWKEPKGNHQKDPWVGKKEPNPPDFDKLFAELFQKIRGLFTTKKISVARMSSSQKNRIFNVFAALIALTVIWFLSGFYMLNPTIVAVTLKKFQSPDVAGTQVIHEAQK